MKPRLLLLERYLLWVFIALIPFQARHIFYAQGWFFNEYLSMAVYVTDILFVGLCMLWLLQSRWRRLKFTRGDLLLAAFLLAAAFSISRALAVPVAGYRLVKLLEMAAVFLYFRKRALTIASPRSLLWALVAGGILQAGIGIGQFVKQGDLGLQRFGESVLAPDMRGVAAFLDIHSQKIMRAYGTFPHPNVLATYLLIVLGGLYALIYDRNVRVWWYLLYSVMLTGFLLTYSRTAIVVWGVLMVVMLFFKRGFPKREILFSTLIILAIFSGLFWKDVIGRFTIHQSDESIVLREYYNGQALHSNGRVNWLGVGIGNFVPWLMQEQPHLSRILYQPAHNLYLLLYAEIGMIGVGLFLAWLIELGVKAWLPFRWNPLSVLGIWLWASFLFLALFDHYFWTLQQGMIMWWAVHGLIARQADSRYTRSSEL